MTTSAPVYMRTPTGVRVHIVDAGIWAGKRTKCGRIIARDWTTLDEAPADPKHDVCGNCWSVYESEHRRAQQ